MKIQIVMKTYWFGGICEQRDFDEQFDNGSKMQKRGENCWGQGHASRGGKARRLMITRLEDIQVGEGQCFIQVC